MFCRQLPFIAKDEVFLHRLAQRFHIWNGHHLDEGVAQAGLLLKDICNRLIENCWDVLQALLVLLDLEAVALLRTEPVNNSLRATQLLKKFLHRRALYSLVYLFADILLEFELNFEFGL